MHRLSLSAVVLGWLLGTLAVLASPAAGVKLGVVPTQVIIQLTAAPAALRLPTAARRPGATSARTAALSAAVAPVSAQQAAFRTAARRISFRQDFSYQHVRPELHLQKPAAQNAKAAHPLLHQPLLKSARMACTLAIESWGVCGRAASGTQILTQSDPCVWWVAAAAVCCVGLPLPSMVF